MEYVTSLANTATNILVVSAVVAIVSLICGAIKSRNECKYSVLTYIFILFFGLSLVTFIITFVVGSKFWSDKSSIDWANTKYEYKYNTLKSSINSYPDIINSENFQKDVDSLNSNVSDYNKICGEYELPRINYFNYSDKSENK